MNIFIWHDDDDIEMKDFPSQMIDGSVWIRSFIAKVLSRGTMHKY